MNNQLRSTIVRIFAADDKVAGAGFLIPERRVFTYANVVAEALNLPPGKRKRIPDGEVSIDFPLISPGERIKAKVIFWQPGPATAKTSKWGGSNIAVLEMSGPPPGGPVSDIPKPSPTHYSHVAKSISDGRVVFFLGAGASLFGRPKDATYRLGGPCLPTGGELAEHLARSWNYMPYDLQDLLRISQYVALTLGSGPLYESLRKVFDADYDVTDLHSFLAGLPSTLRAKGSPNPYQLIVTTNYDDLVERAFEQKSEPYDLLFYMAEGESRGKFFHRRYNGGAAPPAPLPDGSVPPDYLPDNEVREIEKPNQETSFNLEQRSIILKIHGAVDRKDAGLDSYVITEDHYIDYLTRTDVSNLLPAPLVSKLHRSHFLFLGYSLRDWNLRVILYRLWGESKLRYKSWAIQSSPSSLDREFWQGRNVDIIDARLETYIEELGQRIG